ncbi:MAG TPA: HlyD family efflux transporter periplasmic adaptor subunit [Flavisolibacter sp.]|jgi:multidrug efflux pump subunit AcrA (membrane-fusion protein)|nr:HlyD family efflux transporter periplasmic adaptor subunit [Flavisolibacter sp.]
MYTYLTKQAETTAERNQLNSFKKIYGISKRTRIRNWFWYLLILLLIILFLPWTQNIRARGNVTTLRQEQRPQEVNTVIAGTVLAWHVKEGDFVRKGDTLLQLGEVKVDYFDPELLDRTQEQIQSKKASAQNYLGKAGTADKQFTALKEALQFKLQSLDTKIQQQELKVNSDQADLQAAENEQSVYKRQIDAARIMLDSGAISLTEYEKRRISFQNSLAKINIASNKLEQARQELVYLKLEKQSAVQDYADKMAKAEGEQYSSLSNAASTDAEVSKLKNLYSSYSARNKLYYITAPQSGQIIRARKAGIGEFVKEGEMVVEIVPDTVQYAVELFIKPMDIPLISPDQKVRFIFDGFPAIVFNGWPGGSYGTFGGKVLAIEKSARDNGKFRILITEDPQDRKWPAQLRIGGGADGILLLKDVPIYYELWRNINGFPPEYYTPENAISPKK